MMLRPRPSNHSTPASSAASFFSPLLLFLLLLLAFAAPQVKAQDNETEPAIYRDSDVYNYHGCYHETTEISSSGMRAISGGSNLMDAEEMTVPMCLDFCAEGGDKKRDRAYTYAALEYSSECWCGQAISGMSENVKDSDCSLPCNGDDEMVCGGRMRLAVYKLQSVASARLPQGLGGSRMTALVALLTISLVML